MNTEDARLSCISIRKTILQAAPNRHAVCRALSAFTEKGAVIIGVSKDSVASHKKFEEKFNLPFTLLSDTELSCIKAYDVWKEKTNYGKKTMGVVRTTYLIDENGIIQKAAGNVRAADNPAKTLELL